jgi:hypothetical protein
MEVVPILKPRKDFAGAPRPTGTESGDWTGYVAGGSLLAAGLLLLAGQRRAGLLVAASGTALVLLGEQETVRSWWNALPGYIDEGQQLINQLQGAMDGLETQRGRLEQLLARVARSR